MRGRVTSEAGDYLLFYENLYQALQGKEDLVVKPQEALDVIRLIELAYQSSESGKELTV